VWQYAVAIQQWRAAFCGESASSCCEQCVLNRLKKLTLTEPIEYATGNTIHPTKMSSAPYEEEYAAVAEKHTKLCEMLDELLGMKQTLADILDIWKQKMLQQTGDLSQKERLELRRALTIVGQTLTSASVIFGKVELVDDDPVPTERGYCGNAITLPYSFEMTCEFVGDCAMGVRYSLVIRTRSSAVRTLVRHMFRQRGFVEDTLTTDMDRTEWLIDWDYHKSIEVIEPLSESDYFDESNTTRRFKIGSPTA
jgi:hypothetical protein